MFSLSFCEFDKLGSQRRKDNILGCVLFDNTTTIVHFTYYPSLSLETNSETSKHQKWNLITEKS